MPVLAPTTNKIGAMGAMVPAYFSMTGRKLKSKRVDRTSLVFARDPSGRNGSQCWLRIRLDGTVMSLATNPSTRNGSLFESFTLSLGPERLLGGHAIYRI